MDIKKIYKNISNHYPEFLTISEEDIRPTTLDVDTHGRRVEDENGNPGTVDLRLDEKMTVSEKGVFKGWDPDIWIDPKDSEQVKNAKRNKIAYIDSLPDQVEVDLKLKFVKSDCSGNYTLDEESEKNLLTALLKNRYACKYASLPFLKYMQWLMMRRVDDGNTIYDQYITRDIPFDLKTLYCVCGQFELPIDQYQLWHSSVSPEKMEAYKKLMDEFKEIDIKAYNFNIVDEVVAQILSSPEMQDIVKQLKVIQDELDLNKLLDLIKTTIAQQCASQQNSSQSSQPSQSSQQDAQSSTDSQA